MADLTNAVRLAGNAEIVRCKKCTLHEDEEPGMVYCPNIAGGWVMNDFFCAEGMTDEQG